MMARLLTYRCAHWHLLRLVDLFCCLLTCDMYVAVYPLGETDPQDFGGQLTTAGP